MGEPTDEQITRHLAGVAGISYEADQELALTHGRYPFSPRTRWEDLGPLIEAHGVTIDEDEEGKRWAMIQRRYGYHHAYHDPDLKRAICLAIYYATGGE